jgi:hypothetical protein
MGVQQHPAGRRHFRSTRGVYQGTEMLVATRTVWLSEKVRRATLEVSDLIDPRYRHGSPLRFGW